MPGARERRTMTRLAYWRRQRGVSQRALAARTGISGKTIERLDQGGRRGEPDNRFHR